MKLNTRKIYTNEYKPPPARIFLQKAMKSKFPRELQFYYNPTFLKKAFLLPGVRLVVNFNKSGRNVILLRII